MTDENCEEHEEDDEDTSMPLAWKSGTITLVEAYKRFEEDFKKNGECQSCGWHALWSEHYVEAWEIIHAVEKNNDVLELPCASKDKDEDDDHRGVYCYLDRQKTGE